MSYLDSPEARVRNGLTLCPFAGRAFVCGVSDAPLIVRDGEVMRDPDATSAPTERITGALTSVGRYPESAWLIAREPGSSLVHAYRRGALGWSRSVEWAVPRGAALAAPWGAGLLASSVATTEDDLDAPVFTLRVVGVQAASSPPASVTVNARATLAPGEPSPVLAMASDRDTLFLAVRRDHEVVVERIAARGARPSKVDRILTLDDASVTSARLWTDGSGDAAVFGRVERAGATAFLSSFEHDAWSLAVLPAELSDVAGYERDAAGREHIVGHDGDSVVFFERTGRGDWHECLRPRLGQGEAIRDAWVVDGEAWVLAWPHDTTKRPPRLLRSGPVTRVWVHPAAGPR